MLEHKQKNLEVSGKCERKNVLEIKREVAKDILGLIN